MPSTRVQGPCVELVPGGAATVTVSASYGQHHGSGTDGREVAVLVAGFLLDGDEAAALVVDGLAGDPAADQDPIAGDVVAARTIESFTSPVRRPRPRPAGPKVPPAPLSVTSIPDEAGHLVCQESSWPSRPGRRQEAGSGEAGASDPD